MHPFIERGRTALFRTKRVLRTHLWFPHAPLAALFILGACWLFWHYIGSDWPSYLRTVAVGAAVVPPRVLPFVLIGGAMMLVGVGLLFRSRVAWTMALLLAAAAAASTVFGRVSTDYALLSYFLFILALLLIAWRSFDRASLAASTLFAVTSVAMLLIYGTFGAYYLGQDFKPAIGDLATALYYAVVTMTTVGYGDITPQTLQARLFSISIIVLGVAVFATSLTAVIAPLISNSLSHIVSAKDRNVKRSNHFVIVGNTALAANTWRELAKRGRAVTRILSEPPKESATLDVDIVVGDPSDIDVLKESGADKA
jgi:voltage-gated potassium channel